MKPMKKESQNHKYMNEWEIKTEILYRFFTFILLVLLLLFLLAPILRNCVSLSFFFKAGQCVGIWSR